MRINIPKGNALIFYQILSTNSLRKCMVSIRLENLYVDQLLPLLCSGKFFQLCSLSRRRYVTSQKNASVPGGYQRS